MEEHSVSYVVGMICGLAAGFLAVAVFAWLIRKLGGKFGSFKCNQQDQYDERQLLARGKAYKAGFFILIIYVTIAGILADLCGIRLLLSFGGIWIGVCFAIFCFAAVCIWEDAYMSLQENVKGINMMFLAVGLLNLINGIMTIRDKTPFIENDSISYHYTNLIVAILFLSLTLLFNLKLLYDKSQEENEE